MRSLWQHSTKFLCHFDVTAWAVNMSHMMWQHAACAVFHINWVAIRQYHHPGMGSLPLLILMHFTGSGFRKCCSNNINIALPSYKESARISQGWPCMHACIMMATPGYHIRGWAMMGHICKSCHTQWLQAAQYHWYQYCCHLQINRNLFCPHLMCKVHPPLFGSCPWY